MNTTVSFKLEFGTLQLQIKVSALYDIMSLFMKEWSLLLWQVLPEGTCAAASTSLENTPPSCFSLCPECFCIHPSHIGDVVASVAVCGTMTLCLTSAGLIQPTKVEACKYDGDGDELVLRVQWTQSDHVKRSSQNGKVHVAVLNSDNYIVSQVVEVIGQVCSYQVKGHWGNGECV